MIDKPEEAAKTSAAEPKRAASFLVASLAAATLLIVSCGGGSDSATDGANIASTPSALQRARALANKLGARAPGAPAAPIQPLLPGDPTWGSEDQCNDAEIIKITSDTNYDAVLLSRHRHCSTLVSPPSDLTVTLMQRVGSATWELYVADTPDIETVKDWTYGTATIETDFAAFGPQARLDKQHAVRLRIVNFSPAADFPIAGANYSAVFSPALACVGKGMPPGTSAPLCSNTAFPAIASLSLASGAQSEWVTANVTFDWAFDGAPRNNDFQEFELSLQDSMPYVIQGTPPMAGNPVAAIPTIDSPDGRKTYTVLRCDKGVVVSGKTGCVYPRAAAVWVLDSAEFPEAADHVRDAQTTIADGRTTQAPGVYTPLAGTRAVASYDFAGPANLPLQREKSEQYQDDNRQASCGRGPNSLFSTRPFVGSATCPTRDSPNCTCDEYPFAATVQGAANFPDATSVRFINGVQNSTSGGKFSGFLEAQRLFDHRVVADDFWVFVK